MIMHLNISFVGLLERGSRGGINRGNGRVDKHCQEQNRPSVLLVLHLPIVSYLPSIFSEDYPEHFKPRFLLEQLAFQKERGLVNCKVPSE